MISLAVADLAVGVNTVVPPIFAAFTETLEEGVCQALGFFNSLAWVVSVYTLTLLSVDRCLAIDKPLHYVMLVTPRRVAFAITLIWLGSALLWILPSGRGRKTTKFNDEEMTCYFNVADHGTYALPFYFIVLKLNTSIFGRPFSEEGFKCRLWTSLVWCN